MPTVRPPTDSPIDPALTNAGPSKKTKKAAGTKRKAKVQVEDNVLYPALNRASVDQLDQYPVQVPSQQHGASYVHDNYVSMRGCHVAEHFPRYAALV